MKIAVMGSGGMGGYYGALLARQGEEVSFIARGAHLEAIRNNGLIIKSIHGDFITKPAIVTDNPAEIGPVDLVLFCVKTYNTDEAAQAIKPMIRKEPAGTVVLSLQNGIDAVERVGEIVGAEYILAGATWVSSAIEAPGVISQVSNYRRVVIGEPDGKITPRLETVGNAFQKTGITLEQSTEIYRIIWNKFMFLSATSGIGSLTRLPVVNYRSIPETRALCQRLMEEVQALAQAQGIQLDRDIIEKSLAFMDSVAPKIKPSMQLDVEAGHQTEIESIIGVIGRKGREFGIATPVADMLYGLLLPVDLNARGS
jgi:2-dehydropantoate 2-reductase